MQDELVIELGELETQESLLGHNLLYQSRILFNTNKKLWLKRFLTYPFRRLISRSNEGPTKYIDFKIPHHLYDCSREVSFLANSEQQIQLNFYRNKDPIQLNKETEPPTIPIECFEPGHNVLSFNDTLGVEQIIFYLKDKKIRSQNTTKTKLKVINRFDDFYVNASISFLINSQVKEPTSSPFQGSCFAMFDYQNRCYRKPHWIWSDSPVVTALLEADIEQVSRDIVDRMCELQQGKSPLDGAILSRYRRYGHDKYPFEALYGPNDTSYMVRWALLPIYEKTGDSKYLHTAQKALDWVFYCLKNHEMVPSHYYLERNKWESTTFIDVALLPEGFAAYNKAVGNINPDWKRSVEKFTNSFIDEFKLDNGFYGQNLLANEGVVTNRLFTRGQGWALAGLLSTYELTGDEKFLREAVELADLLISIQTEEGYWGYLSGYKSPNERAQKLSGPCEKATTVLSYYLTELGKKTNEDKYQKIAIQALDWCEDQMCLDIGPGFGGIRSRNRYSGITSLPFIPIATGYANAYYMLSKLKHED